MIWDLLILIGALTVAVIFAFEGMLISALIAFVIAAIYAWVWMRQ